MLKAGTLEDKEWQIYNPWHQMRPAEKNRPKIIEFRNCDSVQIKEVTLRDGLDWVQKYTNCTNLLIDSVNVQSTTFLNNDGIDIVDCQKVRVTNCVINAADDGICLKSESPGGRCEDIYIAHCRIRSSASAFKLGTASGPLLQHHGRPGRAENRLFGTDRRRWRPGHCDGRSKIAITLVGTRGLRAWNGEQDGERI